MKERTILRATLITLVAVLTLLAVVPLGRAQSDLSSWMTELDDNAPLNTLSIPGTHDSGALHSFVDVFGKCQTLSIKDQLQIGVRFLDIRLQLVNNKLRVVHSIADQMTDFDTVLSDMISFLRENPGEFLIVSFKQDADPKRSDAVFATVLEEMLLSCAEVSRDRSLPETVQDARGKIHILARYQDATVGVPCYDGWVDDDSFTLGGIYVQDNYKVSSAREKISDVDAALAVSAQKEHTLVLNFTSCYLSSGFPPIYAGLPAHEVNNALRERLSRGTEATGVILCDFITSELSELIIRRNFA